MGPYEVKLNPHRGYTYDREILVFFKDNEVAVVNAAGASLEFMERLVGLMNEMGETEPVGAS